MINEKAQFCQETFHMKAKPAKNSRFGMMITGGVITIIILLLLFIAVVPTFARQITPDKLIPPNSAPLVISLMYPASGQVLQPGETASVLLDAVGAYPLTRLKLTIRGPESVDLDETLTGNDESVRKKLLPVMPATPGEYVLVATVFDDQGYSAVSSVVPVQVADSTQATYEEVSVASWEELEQKAAEHGMSPETVVALNPQLIPEDGMVGKPDMEPAIVKMRLAPLKLPPADLPVPEPGTETSPPPYSKLPLLPEGPGVPEEAVTGAQMVFSSLVGSETTRPAPPEMVEATVSGCQIKLVFKAGSDSSRPTPNGYFIYRSTGSDFKRIATVIHAKFDEFTYLDADLRQNTYDYYVSTFNSAGESMGEIIHLEVDTPVCERFEKYQNYWEENSFTVPNNITDFYCYVSMSHSPWLRIPSNPDEFMSPDADGKINAQELMPEIVDYDRGSKQIAMNCWGWSGGVLTDLGAAEGKFSENQDGDWEVSLSNENYLFGGVYHNGPKGGLEPENVFIPAPVNVQVIGGELACADVVQEKIFSAPVFAQINWAGFCKAIYATNLVVSWDWEKTSAPEDASAKTTPTPDAYELYKIGSVFDIRRVKTIQYPTTAVVVPRDTTEKCYFLRAVYTDTTGHTHRSRKSPTVCLPPIIPEGSAGPGTIRVHITGSPFTMRVGDYKNSGRKKSSDEGAKNCDKPYTKQGGLIGGKSMYGAATSSSYREGGYATVGVEQDMCYGQKNAAYASFDLREVKDKQIQAATLRFNLGEHWNSYPNMHNASCAESVVLVHTIDSLFVEKDNDNLKKWLVYYLQDVPSTWEYDLTQWVHEMVMGSLKEEDDRLVIGILPEEFQSRDMRKNRSHVECGANYGNFDLEITYFEYK
jgi:hypothetical protein